MADLKTKQTDDSVTSFINTVRDEIKRKDSFAILDMMKQVTGLLPKMWGSAIIGFGNYHYKYESGHEGDMCLIGFSPRKQNITLYVINSAPEIPVLFQSLGKYKIKGSCLHINKLSQVNTDILKNIIAASFKYSKQNKAHS